MYSSIQGYVAIQNIERQLESTSHVEIPETLPRKYIKEAFFFVLLKVISVLIRYLSGGSNRNG